MLGLGILTLPHGELRCPAVVDAAQSFILETPVRGSYQWTLSDGCGPGGHSLRQQQLLQYENDLVELRVAPTLASGTRVEAGQPVATFRSLHTSRRLADLQAQRAALVAQRNLLIAGGSTEEVAQAQQGVAIAQAQRRAGQAELIRLRQLAEEGLTSRAELEVAELEDEVRRLRVSLAAAAVNVARVPVRAEALDAFDAQLVGVDAGIEELAHLLEEEQVLCPVAGIAEVGSDGVAVRVDQLDPVYLDIPIPLAATQRVSPGARIYFITPAITGTTFAGRIVELAAHMSLSQGRPVVWASARINNPGLLLRRGMTGRVHIPLDANELGTIAMLRMHVWRSLQ